MPTPFRLAEPSAPPEAGSLQSLASVMAYGLLAKLVGTGVVQGLEPGDPRIIGPYRLLGQLGSGGMGRVFLGLSAGGRRVAVKVIRDELAADPEFRVRFRREVAAARTVSGVFTAAVVDADVEAQAPWLATAYVPGPSLAQAVRDHGPLPAGSVLALAAGLAESLAAIHAAGVVHRDLKPSNVLLAQDGPRVIDFGISRSRHQASRSSSARSDSATASANVRYCALVSSLRSYAATTSSNDPGTSGSGSSSAAAAISK
jgi:serine/threonine protein kinase